MDGAQPTTSRRHLFKRLKILRVPRQYTLLIMNFIISNHENFQTNSSIHNISTTNQHHLCRPNANLACFKKSTFYAGIKILNSLPQSLTILKNEKAKLKVPLRNYLNTHTSYSADEFFMCKDHLQICFIIIIIIIMFLKGWKCYPVP